MKVTTSRAMLSACRLAVVIAWTLGSRAANAQTTCPQQAEVDALEEQGRTLRADHHDAEALAVFQRSYSLCRSPRALARIALAEGALGRWVEAEAHLREAMAQREHPWISANFASLEGELATISRHLGDLELLGTGAPAEVWIDNRRAGAWPTTRPIRVVAGSVTFVVRGEGYADVTRTVTVPAGGLARETIERVAVSAAAVGASASTTATSQPPTGRTQRIVGWVLAGGAVAALGAGAVVTGLRFSEHFRDYRDDRRCTPFETDMEVCEGVYNRAEGKDAAWTPWQAVSFGVGGALAVASVVVMATAPSPRAERATALRCGQGPGVIGVACTWNF